MFINLSHLARDFQTLLMVSQHSAWVLRKLILLKAVKKVVQVFIKTMSTPCYEHYADIKLLVYVTRDSRMTSFCVHALENFTSWGLLELSGVA